MGLLSTIAGLGATAVGAASLFKKPREPEGYGELLESARYSTELAKLMDPRSQGFQGLVGQEEERLRGNFAADLADLMRTNRRSQRLGWGPVLNPERRDETIAGAVTMGREEMRAKARDNILRYLSGAAGAARGATAAYSAPVNVSMGMQDRAQTGRMGGYEALFGGLRQLDQPNFAEAFQQRQGQGPIIWDTRGPNYERNWR